MSVDWIGALLIDETGAAAASHTTPHPISQPKPLSEQNADWWSAMQHRSRGRENR
jgi:hypothetical protein